MNRSVFLSVFLFCFLCISVSGQSLRAAYTFHYKRDINHNKYRVESEMMLDWTPEKAVYYNDASYHSDSLCRIAFDHETGNICNQEAWYEIKNYRASAKRDVFFLYPSKGEYEVLYILANVLVKGKGKMTLPEWNITDEYKITELGLRIRKAFADYLGRKWTVWYCEDIPVPAGPWLLWGTPGLITHAYDSEKIFSFDLLNVDTEGIVSRFADYKMIYSKECTKRYHIYEYDDIKRAEELNNKIRRDYDLLARLAGATDEPTIIVDSKGNYSILNTKVPHIPLIPDEYWK